MKLSKPRSAFASLRACLLAALFVSLIPSPTLAQTNVRDAVGAASPHDLRGTWVLQQIENAAHLSSLETQIRAALRVPGVRGFSMRVRWNLIDTRPDTSTAPNFALLQQGYDIAASEGKEFSVRFMAGRHTPPRILNHPDCPRYSFVEGGNTFFSPTPWKADGSPNQVFEDGYAEFIPHLAQWCRTRPNPVGLLHLAWFGQAWAELNHGIEVRSTPGYTQARWLAAHIRLVNLGLALSDETLSIEFPFSGYGPVNNLVDDIGDHIVSVVGPWSPRVFVQANGLGPASAQAVDGDWGAPNANTEAIFDANVWTRPLLRGQQMIQPFNYPDWAGIFAKLYLNSATYIEVYLPSFNLQHAPQLREEILKFWNYWTTPPTLALPSALVVEATSANGATVEFTVDATDDVALGSVTTSHASGSLFPLGATTVTATAIDTFQNSASSAFTITVVDTTAPTIVTAIPSATTLWPPNHKMVPVTLAVTATDAVAASPHARIVAVTSNEPVNGSGDGNTSPDWEITGDLTVNLRAERSGNGNGRTYTILVEVADSAGNISTTQVEVNVPKNKN